MSFLSQPSRRTLRIARGATGIETVVTSDIDPNTKNEEIFTLPKVSAAYVATRRQGILDAATALFAEHGFAQTSMADVCNRAGLSAGAIYRYFPSKSDLVLAICRGETTETDVATPPDDESAEAMLDRLIAHVHPSSEDRSAHARLVCQIYGDAAIRSDLATIVEQRQTHLRDALAQRITQGRTGTATDDRPDAQSVADVVLAALAGYAALVAIRAPLDHAAFRRTLIGLLG